MYNGHKRHGVSMAEWGVIAALIAIILIFATRNLGYHASCMYQNINVHVSNNQTTYTNGCMDTSQDEIRWTVYAGPSNKQTLNMATANNAYTQSIPLAYSVQHYPITYTIVSGNLPNGLTLNPSTGIITGTPSSNPLTPAYTQHVQIIARDKSSTTRQALYLKIPARGKHIFMYTGSEQQFNVNDAMENITFKAWGAGGGAAGVIDGAMYQQGWGGWDNGDYGGGGGTPRVPSNHPIVAHTASSWDKVAKLHPARTPSVAGAHRMARLIPTTPQILTPINKSMQITGRAAVAAKAPYPATDNN